MTRLLPPNLSELEAALEALTGARVDALDVPLRDLWRAETCPEPLLPWLAWALSIDQWSADWPLHVRRARVAAAIAIQRIKGTAKSVADVVASFGGQVVLREWFETVPAGAPHTFTLTVSLAGTGDAAPSPAFIDAVIAEVRRTKPVRSHFTFAVAQQARARIGLRAVARPVVAARISCQAGLGPVYPANALSLRGFPLTLGGDFLTLGA